MNLLQDVASFAHSLPRLPSDIIVVRKEGVNQTHRDFRVRQGVGHRAWVWLTIHNQYYRALGVTIDTTSLEQLPRDGNISHLLTVTNDCSSPDIPSTVTEPPASDTPTIGGIPAVEDDHLPQSFAAPSMTEQEVVQQSVEQ